MPPPGYNGLVESTAIHGVTPHFIDGNDWVDPWWTGGGNYIHLTPTVDSDGLLSFVASDAGNYNINGFQLQQLISTVGIWATASSGSWGNPNKWTGVEPNTAGAAAAIKKPTTLPRQDESRETESQPHWLYPGPERA